MKDGELGIEAVLIHQMFEAQVARSPDAIGVDYEGEQLNYAELNHRANQLAHHLQANGTKTLSPHLLMNCGTGILPVPPKATPPTPSTPKNPPLPHRVRR